MYVYLYSFPPGSISRWKRLLVRSLISLKATHLAKLSDIKNLTSFPAYICLLGLVEKR